MSDRRKAARRRRAAIATGLSVAGHAVIVLLIALDLDRGADEPAPAPTVEVTLTPLQRVHDRPPPPSRPPASPPSPRRHVPAGVTSSAPIASYAVAAAPSAAPEAAAPAPDLPTALRTGCVGKRGLELERRVDCKLEIWSVLDGEPRRDLPGDAIPDDKQAKWDVVARRQANRRAPISQMGNAKANDCPMSNLGAGCLTEMLLPLTGSEARKRAEGR